LEEHDENGRQTIARKKFNYWGQPDGSVVAGVKRKPQDAVYQEHGAYRQSWWSDRPTRAC